MQSNICNKKWVKQTYPVRANSALGRIIVAKCSEIKKEVDNHNFEAFESKWMHLKILGWKLQRRYCCWEWRIYNKLGYGYMDKMRRKKNMKITSS